MKNLLYFSILILMPNINCSAQKAINQDQQMEFEKEAKNFQIKYMDGNDNCNEIVNYLDTNIQMSEIRFSEDVRIYTFLQLKDFCPHLPKKEIIETTSNVQRMITENIGYDYVSQLYLSKSRGDTIRETSARIWEKKNGNWKIIQLNNSLTKSCD